MATENIFWSNTVGVNWSVVGAANFHTAIASDDADTSYAAAGSSNPNQSVSGLDMINPADAVSKITFVHKSKNTVLNGQKIRDRFVLNSTTTMNGTNVTPATSYTVYTTDYATNGDTAAAWTVAEIEGVGSSGIATGAFVSNAWAAGEARTTYGYVTVTYTYNNPPVAEITAPDDASVYNAGDSVEFEGTGTDTEDGDVTASATWTSDIDGSIGSGGSFSKDDLTAGTHTITMQVEDSGSKTGTDQITLTINAYPVATITSPETGFSASFGTNITFTGTGTDAEDGNLTNGSLVWTSSVDGPIGTGNSVVINTLSQGSHTITLTVTDSNNAQDTDTVLVSITEAVAGVAVTGRAKSVIIIDRENISPELFVGSTANMTKIIEGVFDENTLSFNTGNISADESFLLVQKSNTSGAWPHSAALNGLVVRKIAMLTNQTADSFALVKAGFVTRVGADDSDIKIFCTWNKTVKSPFVTFDDIIHMLGDGITASNFAGETVTTDTITSALALTSPDGSENIAAVGDVVLFVDVSANSSNLNLLITYSTY